MASFTKLRLLLGDQLDENHSWFTNSGSGDKTLYVIAELRQECLYVPHHIQKVSAFFLAMETFAKHLKDRGFNVLHLTLDDTQKYRDLEHLVRTLYDEYEVEQFEFQRCDEYRLQSQLEKLSLDSKLSITMFDTEHFLLPYDEIKKHFKKGKSVRMESFYRKMRKYQHVLMENDSPAGGKWNYDQENRKKIKSSDIDSIPEPLIFANDVRPILKRIKKHKIPTIGTSENNIVWPVNRDQALTLLEYFCTHCLKNFGTFQDAMTAKTPHKWSLFHSRLSFALNTKILHPREVIDQALHTYEESVDDDISLSQIEGFVRQILGWREYIRGMYWVNMPEYQSLNTLEACRPLPGYFWTGNTKMRCMSEAITQSLHFAYAHHIQRLMITGNFCLLAGVDVDEVDQWYLSIYIDAIEWVELPNTRGMSQYGDGGLVSSKPYCSSGNYINKMSDYCKDCYYDVKDKLSEKSCPFNSLYWNFINTHEEIFSNNPRMSMVYRTWNRFDNDTKSQTIDRAQWCLDNLNSL